MSRCTTVGNAFVQLVTCTGEKNINQTSALDQQVQFRHRLGLQVRQRNSSVGSHFWWWSDPPRTTQHRRHRPLLSSRLPQPSPRLRSSSRYFVHSQRTPTSVLRCWINRTTPFPHEIRSRWHGLARRWLRFSPQDIHPYSSCPWTSRWQSLPRTRMPDGESEFFCITRSSIINVLHCPFFWFATFWAFFSNRLEFFRESKKKNHVFFYTKKL